MRKTHGFSLPDCSVDSVKRRFCRVCRFVLALQKKPIIWPNIFRSLSVNEWIDSLADKWTVPLKNTQILVMDLRFECRFCGLLGCFICRVDLAVYYDYMNALKSSFVKDRQTDKYTDRRNV